MRYSLLLMSLIYLVRFSNSLECFTCGQYNTKDGSIIPCPSHDPGEKKHCLKGEQFCMKYVNEGIIVRQCLDNCQEETKNDMSLFCCQQDGCNSASRLQPFTVFVIAVAISFHCVFAFVPGT